MKKFRLIIVALISSLFIFSCAKEENKPETTETLEKSVISAKWVVNNDSDFVSFEFNESGNFIIVRNPNNHTKSTSYSTVQFGTYKVIDDKSIYLSDFGTIVIQEVNDNSIIFSIILTSDPDSEISINAYKHEEINSSVNTDLLCKTWEMVTENGKPVAGTDMELTVMYSKAGSYFVSLANPTEENNGGLAQWKWYNDEEIELLYSWNNEPNWEEEEYVEIAELTATTLKINQHGDTWVLQPVSNKAIRTVIKNSSSVKKGFFNN